MTEIRRDEVRAVMHTERARTHTQHTNSVTFEDHGAKLICRLQLTIAHGAYRLFMGKEKVLMVNFHGAVIFFSLVVVSSGV